MKFHKIECVGGFIMEKRSSLPSGDYQRDNGRLLYNTSDFKIYIGGQDEGKEVIDVNDIGTDIGDIPVLQNVQGVPGLQNLKLRNNTILVEKYNGLPSFNAAADGGRLLYNIQDNSLYYGTDTQGVKMVYDGGDNVISGYNIEDTNITLEKFAGLPSFDTSKDNGRIIYNTNNDQMYIGKNDEGTIVLDMSDTGADVGDVVRLEYTSGGVAGLPAVDGSQLLGIGIDLIRILKPTDLYPADGDVGVSQTVELSASQFISIYSDIPRDVRVFQVRESGTDWEDPSTIEHSVNSDTQTVSLSGDVSYRGRCKDVDVRGHESLGSDLAAFTTGTEYIESPGISVEGSPSDIPEDPTITGTSFSVVGSTDTHEMTDGQVIKTSDSSIAGESLSDTGNLTTVDVPLGNLVEDTEYKFRARYKGTTHGGSDGGETTGKTSAEFVNITTPTLTVEGEPSSVPETPMLDGGSFTVNGGTDSHEMSDWQVIRTNDSTTVWEELGNISDLTNIVVPEGNLEEDTEYKFRVRYKGETYGGSDGSEVTASTMEDFIDYQNSNNIGTATDGGYLGGGNGNVFEANDKDATWALIVSGAEGEYDGSLNWKTTNTATAGTDSGKDGESNTTAICADAGTYPAGDWVCGLNDGDGLNGYTDGYLPAIDEMYLIYQNMYQADQNTTLPVGTDGRDAGEGFEYNYYWSSSEGSSTTYAYYVRFVNGVTSDLHKNNACTARSIRRLYFSLDYSASYVDGTTAIGEICEGGFYGGKITNCDGQDGAMIISPHAGHYDGGQSSLLWKDTTTATAGTDSACNGLTNYNAIIADAGTHPAAEGIESDVNGVSLNGYTDGYLPAIDEIELIYQNMYQADRNIKLPVGTDGRDAGEGFDYGYYWSSSEGSDTTYTYYIRFVNGVTSDIHKYNACGIRSIRRVVL